MVWFLYSLFFLMSFMQSMVFMVVGKFPGCPKSLGCTCMECGSPNISFASANPLITSLAVTSQYGAGSSIPCTFIPQPHASLPQGLTSFTPYPLVIFNHAETNAAKSSILPSLTNCITNQLFPNSGNGGMSMLGMAIISS